jgi:hypothetical protein
MFEAHSKSRAYPKRTRKSFRIVFETLLKTKGLWSKQRGALPPRKFLILKKLVAISHDLSHARACPKL